MRAPDISVVLAVFNAEETIEDTLRSVLVQEGPRFEIIVIDDGSTDSTPQIVDRTVANSANATVIRNRSNRGLTHSLIKGCAIALGRYIARIDAGDRFLQERLAKQYALMERDPLLGMVSCGTRFASAEGVPLYTVIQEPDELARGLACCELGSVRGPSHHGSTMFRRDRYQAVGGYREVFRVAQDLDLWLRISERARVLAMPEVLYESRIFPNSISVERRAVQVATARLILEGARCRRAGRPEPDYAARVPRVGSGQIGSPRRNRSRYEYFIAGCLAQSDRKAAIPHFARAWRASPLNLKYCFRYLRSLLA